MMFAIAAGADMERDVSACVAPNRSEIQDFAGWGETIA